MEAERDNTFPGVTEAASLSMCPQPYGSAFLIAFTCVQFYFIFLPLIPLLPFPHQGNHILKWTYISTRLFFNMYLTIWLIGWHHLVCLKCYSCHCGFEIYPLIHVDPVHSPYLFPSDNPMSIPLLVDRSLLHLLF